MRTYLAVLIAILSFVTAFADEAVVDLGRVAMITSNLNTTVKDNDRVAVYFDIPKEVMGKEIVFAELKCLLDFKGFKVEGDPNLDFMAFNITRQWTQGTDWKSLSKTGSSDIDTTTFYNYTLTISDTAAISMDITEFVVDVVEGKVSNCGIMLVPMKFDDKAFNFPRDFENVIKKNAKVKITYHSKEKY